MRRSISSSATGRSATLSMIRCAPAPFRTAPDPGAPVVFGQGVQLFQAQAHAVAGRGDAHGPAAGVAALLDAHLGVVDLDAQVRGPGVEPDQRLPERLGRGAAGGRVAGADHHLGRVALLGGAAKDGRHHVRAVAGARADAHATRLEVLRDPRGARDQVAAAVGRADHQGAKRLEDALEVRLAGLRAPGFDPAFDDLGVGQDGGHVGALGHAHLAAGGGGGQSDALGGEGVDQRLDRRSAAEIHHGAGPVEHDGLDPGHDGLPSGARTPQSSATVCSAMAKAVEAPVPLVTMTSRTSGAGVSTRKARSSDTA